MPDLQPLRPGDPAPLAGYYRAHDTLGSAIPQMVVMGQGEKLPPLPRGFTWVRIEAW
jgi:hypothetical protein